MYNFFPTFAPARAPNALLIWAVSKLPFYTGVIKLQLKLTLGSEGKSKNYTAVLVPEFIKSIYIEM
jgi:hypothetical protein